jgi:ketohexokinase
VDALGAGDTFNGGMVNAIAIGMPFDRALETACVLAGRKCGMHGFDI